VVQRLHLVLLVDAAQRHHWTISTCTSVMAAGSRRETASYEDAWDRGASTTNSTWFGRNSEYAAVVDDSFHSERTRMPSEKAVGSDHGRVSSVFRARNRLPLRSAWAASISATRRHQVDVVAGVELVVGVESRRPGMSSPYQIGEAYLGDAKQKSGTCGYPS